MTSSLLACGALILPAGARAASIDSPDALRLVSNQQLDPRLLELTFSTPALTSNTGVRILLPTGYGEHPDVRYPVLYLLNGSLGNQTDWTQQGNAEALTAGLPVIVVMPSGGQGGYYSDWYNFGNGGPPQWETYHIDELLPWIDAHYRTIPTRGERAVAGLSMGGFGAFSYPARHPDLFATAASFSGALDTNDPSPTGQPDESTFDGGAPDSTWGSYQTDQIIWRAHNPWDLAANLSGLDLVMRTGNGLPGGPYPYNPADGAIEADVHQANLDMDTRLNALGIPHFFQDYGPGDHSWPYWQHDLSQTLPQIMADFAHPPPSPTSVTFTAAEPRYSVYGWSVAVARPAMEFSTLEHAAVNGFALAGSGSATVTTPPDYRPGSSHPITVTPQSGAVSHVTAVADSAGRLHVALALGPGNPQQEYMPGATTHMYLTSVAIGAAAPHPRFSCTRPSGRLAGLSLGPVRLGMTRAGVRSRFAGVSVRGRRYMDFFCLTHDRIRVGYPSPTLLRGLSYPERRRVQGRAVLALTANPHYTLNGVRCGARLERVARRWRLEKGFRVGLNSWYLARHGSSRAVMKVRDGAIEEIGIANLRLTRSRPAARRFLRSFY